MGGLNNDGGLFIGWNYVSSNLELQITKKSLGSFGTGMILDPFFYLVVIKVFYVMCCAHQFRVGPS